MDSTETKRREKKIREGLLCCDAHHYHSVNRASARLLRLSVHSTGNKEIFQDQPSVNRYSLSVRPPNPPPTEANEAICNKIEKVSFIIYISVFQHVYIIYMPLTFDLNLVSK